MFLNSNRKVSTLGGGEEKKVFLGILGNERGGKKIKGSEDDEGTSLIADVKSC